MRLAYRPEIDGLRAISVLGVLFYHAGFSAAGEPLFSGGFLGVDVFFVISGFLITSLLVGEHQNTGGVSLTHFYLRRARRLLPALLAVLLASLPLAWWLLYPEQLIDFAKSLLASLLFVSNFYWHVSLQAYGVESALLKPLLHTWSLGVEEQFYLLFPILLIALLKYLPHRASLALWVIAFASFALALWLGTRDPSMSFYLLPARLWELLAGGLLALHAAAAGSRPGRFSHPLVPAAGLILITASFFLFDNEDKHPGVLTLMPVLGTLMIIVGAGRGCMTTGVLSNPGFVQLGKLSYALYLWHYPIFAFGRIYTGEPGNIDRLLWIFASLALAVLSYRMVETPLRHPHRSSLKTFLVLTVGSTLLLSAVALYAIHNNGLEGRFQRLQQAYAINDFDNKRLAHASWAPLRSWIARTGMATLEEAEQRAAWFAEDAPGRKLLVVGNSHGKDTYNALALNPERYPDLQIARYGIQIGAGEEAYDTLFASPNFHQADTIVLSTRYRENAADYGLDGRVRGDLEALPDVIRQMREKGKAVVLVSNTVEFQLIDNAPVFDAYLRSAMRDRSFDPAALKQLFYQRRDLERYRPINAQLRAIAEREAVRYLDKESLICDNAAETCDGLTDDGYKSFYDYGHLTIEGARFLGRRMQSLGWFTGRD